jgi:hypothetical protein
MVQPTFFGNAAMTTKLDRANQVVARRIGEFYKSMNARDFDRCYRMIDPEVRKSPRSVTLNNYVGALQTFMNRFGSVEIQTIEITVRSHEKTTLYGDREFAVGQTNWTDKDGEPHVFEERWVKNLRTWFTRSTGLVTPAVVR